MTTEELPETVDLASIDRDWLPPSADAASAVVRRQLLLSKRRAPIRAERASGRVKTRHYHHPRKNHDRRDHARRIGGSHTEQFSPAQG